MQVINKVNTNKIPENTEATLKRRNSGYDFLIHLEYAIFNSLDKKLEHICMRTRKKLEDAIELWHFLLQKHRGSGSGIWGGCRDSQ